MDTVIMPPGYTVLAPLGEGGMGVVHLARRDATGERLALKILRTHVVGNDEGRQRLAREVATLSRIRSAWVAEVVDADPWGEIPYVATRYVPGQPLHDHVVDHGPLRGDDLVLVAHGLAEGIAACHAVGVLHRDVKPSNVVLEGRRPVLIDFGLARGHTDPKLTQVGFLLGTPGYLPPEILDGLEPTEATDVHSWAATVLFAATGRPPFGAGDAAAVLARTRAGEADLDGVAQPLRAVLESALSPDPARRPTLGALRTWLQDPSRPAPVSAVHTRVIQPSEASLPAPTSGPSGPPPAPLADPRVPLRQRLRTLVLALMLAVIVGAAAAAWPVLTGVVVVACVALLRASWRAYTRRTLARAARGRRWYDHPRMVLGAPFDLIGTLPSTGGLVAWAGGAVVAEALVSYAAHIPIRWALGAGGIVAALTVVIGPGSDGVRGPVGRVLQPLSRRWQGWMIGFGLLFLAVVGLLLWGDVHGISYAPWPQR